MTTPDGLIACLARLLDVDPSAVPIAGARDPFLAAREWLAARGLGLVPVLDPPRFGWGGPWLARVVDTDGVARIVLAFGSPPGVVSDPAGGLAAQTGDLKAGWVLATLQPPALPALPAPAQTAGRVERLLVASAATEAMRSATRLRALAERGFEGDRYAAGRGTFSQPDGTGHDLTLVEGEALDALGIAPEESRRNVVTRGIDLDGLIGRRFRIGEAECVGRRRCEPCAHLERLTRPGILRTMVHRGGLRADVLVGGSVAVGDPVGPI